jgi:ribonuclease E
MTAEEQSVYAFMGISPLVLYPGEVKNPRSAVVSVAFPGGEPLPLPLPISRNSSREELTEEGNGAESTQQSAGIEDTSAASSVGRFGTEPPTATKQKRVITVATSAEPIESAGFVESEPIPTPTLTSALEASMPEASSSDALLSEAPPAVTADPDPIEDLADQSRRRRRRSSAAGEQLSLET